MLETPEGEISLLLVDDREMTAINGEYRGKPGPTNVLAFAMRDGAFSEVEPRLLGDVVISTETALREAEEMKIPPEDRIIRLLIHGMLHLFGYDHEASGEEDRRMREKTDEIITEIRSMGLYPENGTTAS